MSGPCKCRHEATAHRPIPSSSDYGTTLVCTFCNCSRYEEQPENVTKEFEEARVATYANMNSTAPGLNIKLSGFNVEQQKPFRAMLKHLDGTVELREDALGGNEWHIPHKLPDGTELTRIYKIAGSGCDFVFDCNERLPLYTEVEAFDPRSKCAECDAPVAERKGFVYCDACQNKNLRMVIFLAMGRLKANCIHQALVILENAVESWDSHGYK